MIQEDFEQHVVKLQNALLGFAKSLTHNEDEAKDLLQETSLKALSNKAMYDDSGSIKSWLYTIMRNLFLIVVAIRLGKKLSLSTLRYRIPMMCKVE